MFNPPLHGQDNFPTGSGRPMLSTSTQQGYFNDIPHPYKFWQRWMLVACGAAAVKAGQNHYHQTGDMAGSAGVAAEALARWASWCWIWLFAVLSTGWSLAAWYVGLTSGFWTPCWWAFIPGPVLILTWPLWCGVAWCRHIDFCLFRRGMWYRLFQPLALRTEKHPLVLLQGIAWFCVGLTVLEWLSYFAGVWAQPGKI